MTKFLIPHSAPGFALCLSFGSTSGSFPNRFSSTARLRARAVHQNSRGSAVALRLCARAKWVRAGHPSQRTHCAGLSKKKKKPAASPPQAALSETVTLLSETIIETPPRSLSLSVRAPGSHRNKPSRAPVSRSNAPVPRASARKLAINSRPPPPPPLAPRSSFLLLACLPTCLSSLSCPLLRASN